MRAAAGDLGRHWLSTDGALWLHILKTITAVLLAMSMSMLLDLSQPRIAMITAVVLMQPLAGMVLAKSLYRLAGTALGMVAAVVLGALFVQEPGLYLAGLTVWVAGCTALAVRYRQFRWYGFVLAGYTAALIGVPLVEHPHDLLLAALNRAAEVTLGIICSSAVSALLMPMRATDTLAHALLRREKTFRALAASVLERRVERHGFERRFAELVDDIVGLEAARKFVAYEAAAKRDQTRRLARLNSEFMDACARLHAMHQLLRRLGIGDSHHVIDALTPHLTELAGLLTALDTADNPALAKDAASFAAHLRHFQRHLTTQLQADRYALDGNPPSLLADFDTASELLSRFVDDLIRHAATLAAWRDDKPHSQSDRIPARYENRTQGIVVAATFVRTAAIVASVGWFWIATAWTSGGMAVIATTLTCGLCSTSARPAQLAAQMAAGAALSVAVAYLLLCRVYPAIDGLPLLCAVLAPLIGVGVFIGSRRHAAGYGTGFLVFLCLLAGPDNVIAYTPDTLINNGVAVIAAMAVTAIGLAVVLPPQTPWLVRRTLRTLRGQIALACTGPLDRLNQRFHSSTHDLMFQLRALLSARSRKHRDAVRWTLATLEIGHAMIDLREALARVHADGDTHDPMATVVARLALAVVALFREPGELSALDAIDAVNRALDAAHAYVPLETRQHSKRHLQRDMRRIVTSLHFIRAALLDRDAPFSQNRRTFR